MGARLNRLAEAVLTGTRGLCFWGGNEKDRYTPAYPGFTM